MIKIVFFSLFISIFFVIFKNHQITKSYNEVYIHMTKDELISIAGEPNEVIYSDINNNIEEWRYYRFLLPSSYSIIVKNETVIDKKILMSP